MVTDTRHFGDRYRLPVLELLMEVTAKSVAFNLSKDARAGFFGFAHFQTLEAGDTREDEILVELLLRDIARKSKKYAQEYDEQFNKG